MSQYVKPQLSTFNARSRIPVGFLDELKNQRNFLDVLAKRLHIKQPEDWYQDVINYGGGTLLGIYNGSLRNTLATLYPEFYWSKWKFSSLSKNFWENTENQIEFMEFAGEALGIVTWEDWYSVTTGQLQQLGAHSLLDYYNHSISKTITSIFPQYDWKLWKFQMVPKHYWDDDSNGRQVLESIGKELGIMNWEEWYCVSVEQLERMGVISLVNKNGGFIPMLQKYFPEHPWKMDQKVLPSKAQRFLFITLHAIFPQVTDIHDNYAHSSLRDPDTDLPIQFDVFIPSLHLAFEYQGEQHYLNHFQYGTAILNTQRKDDLKISLCKQNGIDLIVVPYWWDRMKNSLMATIHQMRPDLIPFHLVSKFTPISKTKQGKKQNDVK